MRRLAGILDPAEARAAPDRDGDGAAPEDALHDDPFADLGLDPSDIDLTIVAACAGLDHSDTANGQRLRRHFGRNLAVMQTENARSIAYLAWAGTHWDAAAGLDEAHVVAQKIGDLVKLEADHLTQRRGEAQAAFEARRARRKAFGVTTKNRGRIDAMLGCAAPHLRRHPDKFNADPLVVATADHTLRFTTFPGAQDGETIADYDATPGHAREDWITKVVPVLFDCDAAAPKWTAFLERFLPVPNVRDCVQTFSGIGLLGVPLQNILFHYGLGANGKSVFMETLSRILGPLSVDLPAESLMGVNERAGAGASPDLARLYCARTVRVSELPANTPLREDLVKKLTGGERIPVRDLFKGFFDFKPIFKAHLSGNALPKIDGTDDGIWRRMGVIEWPIKIPVEERRPFEDVVGEFVAEAPGILNWLISGALTYLEKGFTLPPEVRRATDAYRDEMDPIGQFIAACVAEAPGDSVTARDMYNAYEAWSHANAKRPVYETKFGMVAKTKMRREDARIRRYLDVALHDVPARFSDEPWERVP